MSEAIFSLLNILLFIHGVKFPMASMRRKVSLAVLLVLIVALGVMFFKVVAPFILPLFLAGVTTVVCQPLFKYFLKRTKDRISVAAALTTGTIMAAILIPLITGILIASLQLYTFGSRITGDTRWLLAFRSPAAIKADELANEEEAFTDESISSEETGHGEGVLDAGESASVVTEIKPLVSPYQTATVPEDGLGSESQPALSVKTEKSETETYFVRGVSYFNSWLPDELHREPEEVAGELRSRFNATMHDLGDRSLGRAAGTTFGILSGAAGVFITALVGLMMYVVALYYFLADGTTLLLEAERLIPVHATYQRQLLNQFALVVRSVVVATFLAAFAQGVATTLALWFFGFDHLFVLLTLACVSALIPIAGTWLVWVPCAVILIVSGHWFQAFLLAIYGAAFVGFLDNVVRTYVLNNGTKLHPLLAFISILGGLQVMGLWGVFIGPIVASCLHALVKIFNHELFELAKEKDMTEVAVPT